ncbi:MAG TPA: hypothetical protein VEK08_24475 [Planctomycetota bacterium]|nr:hypothetical protein [Planctomycetota bacterium]
MRLVIDDVAVEGRINQLSRRWISIEITKPYKGVSDGSYIPYFAAGLVRFEEDGKLTERGRCSAERLLRQLFLNCRIIDENKGEILKLYKEVHQRHAAACPKSDEQNRIREERKSLRLKFRSGQISNVEYQKRLGPLKKAQRDLALMPLQMDAELCAAIRQRFGASLSAESLSELLRLLVK